MTHTRQPNEMMCIGSGATRPTLILPTKKARGGLSDLTRLATFNHVVSHINSSLGSTRNFWRERHPETRPLWKEFDQ